MSDYTHEPECHFANCTNGTCRKACDCPTICAAYLRGRADEREKILAPHREIDADNSCLDPDCCGGPFPDPSCELCGSSWPCPTIAAARGEGTE